METLYYVTFAVGGIALLSSLLLGGGEADGDLDVHAEGDSDIDTETGHVDHALDHGTSFVSEVLGIFSIRNITFFTAFFGMTGSILTWLGAEALFTMGAALSMGGGLAFALHATMKYLRASESGSVAHEVDIIGRQARVVVPIVGGRTGKIQCSVGGHTRQLLAKIDENEKITELRQGATVHIIEVNNKTAIVVPVAGELEE